MSNEIEEIMDESETFNPKEYIKNLNIQSMLAFLPNALKDTMQDPTNPIYIQFCFYKGEWVLACFRNGDGSLGTIPAITDNYNRALFVKTVTDTGIGNKININRGSSLCDTLEAKAIKEGLKELFNLVSSPYINVLQEHRSVAWYVIGLKK